MTINPDVIANPSAPVMEPATSVLEVLIRARDGCARKGGWMQEMLCPEEEDGWQTECCCAMGWINKAGTGDARATNFAFDSATYGAFRSVVGDTITGWNDELGRTQTEVIAAFDAAIERERAKA